MVTQPSFSDSRSRRPPEKSDLGDRLARGSLNARAMVLLLAAQARTVHRRHYCPVEEPLPLARCSSRFVHMTLRSTPPGFMPVISRRRAASSSRSVALREPGPRMRRVRIGELLHCQPANRRRHRGHGGNTRARGWRLLPRCRADCKHAGERRIVRTQDASLHLELERNRRPGAILHAADERLANSVEPMRLCNADREFRRVLPAVRKEDQLAARVLNRASGLHLRRRNLPQERIRKHLRDLLKACALGADRRGAGHPAPVGLAMRTHRGPFVARARNKRARRHRVLMQGQRRDRSIL